MSLSKLILLASCVLAEDTPSCTALAMSGGGSFGAWEAGVLWGMYYTAEDPTQFQYDVVSGVSAGAINGAAVATFAPGDEVNMLNTLSTKWQELTQDQLYSMWKPLGLVTGVLKESGLLNTQPLHDFLDTFFDDMSDTFKRKLVVSSVDANSGNYIQWNETSSDPMKSVLSSAAIPFVFPDQKWDDG